MRFEQALACQSLEQFAHDGLRQAGLRRDFARVVRLSVAKAREVGHEHDSVIGQATQPDHPGYPKL